MVLKDTWLQVGLLSSIVIYFSQGPFYPSGSFIAKISLAVILSISLILLCRVICLSRTKKPIVVWLVFALLLLNLVGFFISLQYEGVYFSQIRNILTVLLPFFAFYSLSKEGVFQVKHLRFFFLVLLLVFVASFFHSRITLMLEQDRENVVSNTAYLFVSLIPFLFFLGGRRIVSFIALFLLMLFTILAAKRGAIFTGAIGALLYLAYAFIYTIKERKLSSYLILFLGLAFLVFFVIHIYESNEFLIRRMEAIVDGGSGRDRIYTALLSAWYHSDSLLNYFFGYGFVATVKYSGSGHLAHNDWIELLVNFGLFGVGIYLALFLSLMRLALNEKIPVSHRFAVASVSSMWFLQTLFSMYYTASSSVVSMIVLGYILGQGRMAKGLHDR